MGAEGALWHMFKSPWFPVRLDELPCQLLPFDLNVAETVLLHSKRGQTNPTVVRDSEVKKELSKGQRGQAGPVVIRAHRCLGHPRDGVYIYRIEHGGASVVMATDVEAHQGGDVEFAKFAAGADLLIHDAQYTEAQYLKIPAQGFGHSTPKMACELAAAAKVKRLILTHHSPENDDAAVKKMIAGARKHFAKTDGAFEGTVIELGSSKRRRKSR
jgi:ribonuclease BN (tRNA processing enzyme)